MPGKGLGWQWQHVPVVDRDGTQRLVTIDGTCNGSFHSALYFKADSVGNEIIPDGSKNETDPAVACAEPGTAVEAWAVAAYPTRNP